MTIAAPGDLIVARHPPGGIHKKSPRTNGAKVRLMMKRRALTTALLFGWMAAPALAADPLPALKETPMLADQVKSGALPGRQAHPPAALGGHALRRRRRAGPAGWPAQHAGRQRARYASDDDLQLHAPHHSRRQVQAEARHPQEATRTRTDGNSPSNYAPATNGRTANPSLPRTSVSSGKTSPTTRNFRVPVLRSSCWSTASLPRSRSSIR